jgi:hypothetical protein
MLLPVTPTLHQPTSDIARKALTSSVTRIWGSSQQWAPAQRPYTQATLIRTTPVRACSSNDSRPRDSSAPPHIAAVTQAQYTSCQLSLSAWPGRSSCSHPAYLSPEQRNTSGRQSAPLQAQAQPQQPGCDACHYRHNDLPSFPSRVGIGLIHLTGK